MTTEILSQAKELYEQGRLDYAERFCRAHISDGADTGGLHIVLGHILADRGQPMAALDQFATAEALGPLNVDATNAQAALLIEVSRLDDAETKLKAALTADPNHTLARRNLVKLHLLRGQPDAAREAIAPLIARAQLADTEDWSLYARALRETDNFLAANAAYERGLSGVPNNFELRHGRAITWLDGGRPADAAREFAKLAAERPDDANLHANQALALKRIGDLSGALGKFDAAVELAPEDANVIYTRSITRMAMGNFSDTLQDFERRFEAVPHDCAWRNFPGDRWDGTATEGTLLVWQEQGIGDEIMYLSLLPCIVERVGRLIVECDPRLIPLLERHHDDVEFLAKGSDVDEVQIDHQIPMASLMGTLNPWPASQRPAARSLEPDGSRRDHYIRKLVTRGDESRIGIAWRSARRRVGPEKSIPLGLWAPIMSDRNAKFVNLQYGETETEISAAKAETNADIVTISDLDHFNDIDGLAALIDGLDLVITSSNVTAHLAGALGTTCWVMVQQVPLWYWGIDGEDSLFYPSVRLFRQRQFGEWGDTIFEVASELNHWLSQK